jgi:hypothetical protein
MRSVAARPHWKKSIVSLSWRNETRISLAPDRVALARVSRGWNRSVSAKHVIDVAPTGAVDWSAAIEALRQALQDPAWRKADATVVLSNHFVRYALVPWSEHLVKNDEKRAWVEHHFEVLYGALGVPVEYRWTDDRPSAPWLASAVDAQLIAEIGASFSAASVRLASVQPYLMAAFNRCRPHLKNASAWIVLPERGRVCFASVAKGEWQAVTCRSIGEDWQDELTRFLDRERLLTAEAPAFVLAYAPEVAGLNLDAAGIPVRVVTGRPLKGYSPQVDAGCAIALTGMA